MSFGLKNVFTSGVVDTDSAPQYVKSDTLIKAENIDIINQGDNGIIKSIRGNVYKGGRIAGGDVCVGFTVWDNYIYLIYTSASDNYIQEYDSLSGIFTLVVRGDLGIPFADSESKNITISADVVSGVFLNFTTAKRLSDGSLEGIGEPKRIHIEDAKLNPTTYSDFSSNLDKPDKLTVSGTHDPTVTNNLLKYHSFIFYRRYTNKYNEQTVLSYPSNNVDVSLGTEPFAIFNRVDINGFVVPDNIINVDILVSNDSDNTFKIIKSIDTSVNKTIADIAFYNNFEYPVLDKFASDMINNEFPLTATEQEVVDKRIVYGDVVNYYKFTDKNGDLIDKSKPFIYSTSGVDYNINKVSEGGNYVYPYTGSFDVDNSFEDGQTYVIYIRWSWENTTLSTVDRGSTYIYYTYFTGDDYLAVMNAEMAKYPDSGVSFVAYGGTGTHNFSIVAIPSGGDYSFSYAGTTVYENTIGGLGLNSDFKYKGGIVFLDDKGRHLGVSNITEIKKGGNIDTIAFNVTTNLGSSGITPPSWATKYMMVRDKVNTNLSYSAAYDLGESFIDTGTIIYQLDTPYYVDYLKTSVISSNDESGVANESIFARNYEGNNVTIYSKSLQKNVEVYVMTEEDKALENDSARTNLLPLDKVCISMPISESLQDNYSVVLYQQNKEVESKTEVFYETSDVYNISYGVGDIPQFSGDGKTLNWYDTRVVEYKRLTFSAFWTASTSVVEYPIMKTDLESYRDLNHLGRGAYIYSRDVDMKTYATLIHSQNYSPSTNYNGLNIFSSLFSNFVDIENKYGRIVKLHYDDTNLIIGQERKWHKMLINKSLLTSATGTGVVEKSTSFFNQLQPYAGDFGITDKRSFIHNGFRKYSVDGNNGVITRLSTDGINKINGSRDFEITEIIKSMEKGSSIIGAYDPSKEEYVVVFTDSGRVFRFSETIGNQAGEYVFNSLPSQLITLNDHLYSINSDDQCLYLENSSESTQIYGEDIEHIFELVVNKDNDKEKDYIALSTQSNIAFDVELSTENNSTDIDNTEFVEREDVFYADILKSSKDGDESVFGVGTVSSILNQSEYVLKQDAMNVRVGDDIFTGATRVGEVESFDGVNIVVKDVDYAPVANQFLYTKRSSKLEGKPMKGNYCKIKFTNSSGNHFHVKGVNTQINLSSHI